MARIYCDNGSTSFPKAPGLGKVVGEHIDYNGYNISRGGYSQAYTLESQVIDTRELLCEFFHFENPKQVIFTSGATMSLNMVLKGLLKEGDHVITSSMEHNAVVRPLAQLQKQGVLWSQAVCDEKGRLASDQIRKLIRPETKLVLVLHASNVCGTLLPIEEIGRICKAQGIYFCVDGSQTAGSVDINMKACGIDILVFPGHKGLMGPQGIGGMILSDTVANVMPPLLSGGTGSLSEQEEMPSFLPDKFQPGTLNLPGIIGLRHALEFLKKEGITAIGEKKRELTERFLEAVGNMNGLSVAGLSSGKGRGAVVSLDFSGIDNAEASYLLESEFGIMTRCGLHCAPHAHKTLGTFPRGTVRFSFGYFNTREEIDAVADGVHKLLKEL